MHHWFTYPNIDPIAFRLGPVSVHWYGISYLIGFIAVYLWMSRPEGRRRLGLTREQIQDFLVYALIGVLIGGRTFFVINDIISQGSKDPSHSLGAYLAHPLNFIAVWNGGMAFHGGALGVIVAMALFLRKHPGLTIQILGDEVVVMAPVGIALTRFVNFINDELWGDACYPDRPWCMVPGSNANIPANMQGAYLHPAQLYEMVLDALTLPVLLLLYKRRLPDGVVGWSWIGIYGITRTIAETWRHADFTWHGLTGGQLYALPMIPLGIVMAILTWRNGKRTDERIVDGNRAAVSTTQV